MEDWLSVHERAYGKVYFLYSLVFVVNIIALIFLTVNYCLSKYSLEYFKEDDPDIDLTGLKGFSFSQISHDEYSPTMSNLGTTGKLFFDCYKGSCTYEKSYRCKKTECTGEGEDRKCHTYYDTCYDYDTQTEYGCSAGCRIKQNSFFGCGSSYCRGSSYSGYHYSSSSCSRSKNSKDYSYPKSCLADNLILYWKNFYYERENNTGYKQFTYLNSAVSANESCPLGKKVCGILDDLGNKYCYPEFADCPINYISTDSKGQGYNSASFNNKVIYYSNKVTDGKIVGGLFVDTDLLTQYDNKDCKILDEGTASELIDGHTNQLYRDTIKIDKTSATYKNAKSYLKWCIPGYGKEKNISKIKELKVVFDFNVTNNKDVINPIKSNFTTSYGLDLTGFLIIFIVLIILIFSFQKQNAINTYSFSFFGNRSINYFLLLFFIISFILLTIGSIIGLVNNKNLNNGLKLDLGYKIFNLLKSMNIIAFCINLFLIILAIIFIAYLYITPNIEPTNTNFHKFNDNGFSLSNYSKNNEGGYNSSDNGYNSSDYQQPLNQQTQTTNNGHQLTEDEIRGGFTYQ